MLKQTISYKNFNDQDVTDTLYFNISRTELVDNIHLKDQFESLSEKFNGPDRDLTPDEVRQILDLVKVLMKLAYGVKSDDGKRFIKGEKVWEEFTQTAAYDAFLFSLFENAEKAIAFMVGVIPSDLRDQVESEVEARVRPLLRDHMPKQERQMQVVELPQEIQPARDWSQMGTADIVELSPEEFAQYKAWQQSQQ